MLRIQIRELVHVEGSFYLGNAPFSGVGYADDDERNIRTMRIEGGSIVGTYTALCANGVTSYRQIDVTGLIADDENAQFPLDYEGGNFTGIGYGFQDGFCIYEMLFVRGVVQADYWFDEHGVLLAYNCFGNLEEHYRWFAAGRMETASVSSVTLRIILDFLDGGMLQSLIVKGEVLARLPEIAELEHFPVKTLEALGKLRGGPRVFLAGSGVNDQLFSGIATSQGARW